MVTQPGRHLTSLLHPRLQRLGARRLTRAQVALSERPELGRIAAQGLQSAAAALAHQLQCPLQLEAHLLDAAAGPASGLSQSAVFFVLQLSALGDTAVLELEPAVLLAAVERIAGAPARPGPVSMLTRIEEATLSYLVLCALAAFRAVEGLERGFAPRLAALTLNRAEAAAQLDARQRHVALGVRLGVDAVEGAGRLLLPAVALHAAAQGFARELPAQLAPQVAAAGVPARCFLGQTQLPADVFAALEPGDVVLFDALGLQGGAPIGPARLVTRGFTLLGSFGPEGFTLTRAPPGAPLQEDPMKSSSRMENEVLPPLPVEIEVELTRLMLPVAELATLRIGALLPLRISAAEPVLLRVGARAVARAELVDIDGEVGARILELLS